VYHIDVKVRKGFPGTSPSFSLSRSSFANNGSALESLKVGYAYVLIAKGTNLRAVHEIPCPELSYCPEIPPLLYETMNVVCLVQETEGS